MNKETILAASFEGLDDASGDVRALPLRIAGLLADNEPDRRDAIHAVSYRLYHQGTLATATVRAVPLLIEIAFAPDARARGAAASLSAFCVSSASAATRVAPAIENALQSETDPLALANELCAFGLAARRGGGMAIEPIS